MKYQFETACPSIRIRMKENLELLGIPIFEEAYGESFGMKEHKLELLMSRLDQVSPHVAYFLLKNCLFVPKLT
jgi:hypothetical protein